MQNQQSFGIRFKKYNSLQFKLFPTMLSSRTCCCHPELVSGSVLRCKISKASESVSKNTILCSSNCSLQCCHPELVSGSVLRCKISKASESVSKNTILCSLNCSLQCCHPELVSGSVIRYNLIAILYLYKLFHRLELSS